MSIGNPKGFLQEARHAQAAHRDNLAAGGGGVLEGQEPAALKMMPAMAKQLAAEQAMRVQAAPQATLNVPPPSLGMGGQPGLNMSQRVPKPPTNPNKEE